jgi:hypothetical protein
MAPIDPSTCDEDPDLGRPEVAVPPGSTEMGGGAAVHGVFGSEADLGELGTNIGAQLSKIRENGRAAGAPRYGFSGLRARR